MPYLKKAILILHLPLTLATPSVLKSPSMCGGGNTCMEKWEIQFNKQYVAENGRWKDGKEITPLMIKAFIRQVRQDMLEHKRGILKIMLSSFYSHARENNDS